MLLTIFANGAAFSWMSFKDAWVCSFITNITGWILHYMMLSTGIVLFMNKNKGYLTFAIVGRIAVKYVLVKPNCVVLFR